MNLVAAHTTLHSVDAEDRIAWVSQALCRATDPDELFVRGAAQRKAAVICRHCPVMQECGADALDNKVEFGVWGGMTERQRRALLKQHPEIVAWSDFFDKRNARSVGSAPAAAAKGLSGLCLPSYESVQLSSRR